VKYINRAAAEIKFLPKRGLYYKYWDGFRLLGGFHVLRAGDSSRKKKMKLKDNFT
jgi:hypothetical protein